MEWGNFLLIKVKAWAQRLKGVQKLGSKTDVFPPYERALRNGCLAVGGDLSPERLLAAYTQGIFPFSNENEPLLWYCPHPRFVLDLQKWRVPKNIQRANRLAPFEFRLDTQFEAVIRESATIARKGQGQRWLTEELVQAFLKLHEKGYAHSAEAWNHGRLEGGLFGVALGNVWFGESLFSAAPDAGNFVFTRATEKLKDIGFSLVDCQFPSAHIARFGAESWPRERFLAVMSREVKVPRKAQKWLMEP